MIRIRLTGPQEEIEDFLRRLPNIHYPASEEIEIGANVQADFHGNHYQFINWKKKEDG